jgi:hypothetical protein
MTKDLTPDAPSSTMPRSNRRRRALDILGSATLLSTIALLPLIDPKNPPFRAD